ncbi:MAG: hypothetical protein J3R72DRAFT_126734 [Linnemannia gamsii]|nr:MAG: hypothetical protein J3R72DRAFT_126734 [Linnemannia gamsii]
MSSTVFTFRPFDNNEKFFGHQRDLATRGLYQQSSSSPSPFEEVDTTSNDAHLSFSSSTSESSPHQHQQDPTLPTVQITRDSTSLIITPPRGSRFSASHTSSHETSSTTITTATARTLEYTWLRDNCPCPKCLHAPTRQKLHSTEQVPRDISVSSIQVYEHGLEVTWSKGLQIPQTKTGVVGEEGDEDVSKEALLLKAQPGHQSFYPWEMIFAR